MEPQHNTKERTDHESGLWVTRGTKIHALSDHFDVISFIASEPKEFRYALDSMSQGEEVVEAAMIGVWTIPSERRIR